MQKQIRVKFMARPEARIWRRQLPDAAPVWGNCEFIFDADERNYDWLVVYDDLPPTPEGERRSVRREPLSCPKEHTLLVTSEPSSIKSYFTDFTDQFGAVLTSQPAWALPHKHRHFQQPALQWFYGVGAQSVIPFDQLKEPVHPSKTHRVSTVGSSKQQTHTLHKQRFEFIEKVSGAVPDLDVFGRGYRPMDDKAEALKPYFFHLAVENHLSAHHWTEKLSDVFLAEAVPLYVGCPNVSDYFPEQSYIALDINQPDQAIELIKQLDESEYQKRLPAVLEAKRRVLYEYNLFATLAKIIEESGQEASSDRQPTELLSRRLTIKRNGFSALRHVMQKARLRLIHRFIR